MTRISAFTLTFVLCVCSIVAAAFAANQFAVHDDIINTVNSKQSTWKAAHNQFSKMTVDQVKQMLGTTNVPQAQYTEAELNKMRQAAEKSLNGRLRALPDAFDSRQQWPKCIHPIRDQGHCGSCWAFSSSEVLSDRFCIASNGTINTVLSPQDLVSCDWTNMGCNGGILPIAWAYLHSSGIVDDACFPYQSATGDKVSCPKNCVSGQPIHERKFKASHWYHVGSVLHPHLHEQAIAQELVDHGPVQTGFKVYQDFISYSTGVYSHVTGSELGGHAVKIVGYGVSNGTKFWSVANSWSEKWGEQGFFRIKKGNNECGIEGGVYTGLADVDHAPKL